MPTYEEIFNAQITIDIPDLSSMIESLRQAEQSIIAIVAGMNTALSGIGGGGKLGRAREFGESISGIIGARGGFQTTLTNITSLAAELDTLAVSSGQSVGQVTADLQEMAVHVADAAGISVTHIGSFINELVQIGDAADRFHELGGEVDATLQSMVDGLTNTGKKIYQAIVDPFAQAHFDVSGGSEVPEMADEVTGTLRDMAVGVNAAMEHMNIAGAFEEQSERVQRQIQAVAKSMSLGLTEFQRLDVAAKQAFEGIAEARQKFDRLDISGVFGDPGQVIDDIIDVKQSLDPLIGSVGRLRQSYRLATAEGGNLFAGLRMAVLDVTPATSGLVKAFDFMAGRLGKSRQEFAAIQRDLQRLTEAGSDYADSTRNASTFLKDLSQAQGGLRREINGIEKALNKNVDAWNVMNTTAQASGEVTERSMANVEAQIRRARKQIEAYQKAAAAAGVQIDPATKKRLEELNTALRAQQQRLDYVRATAKAASGEMTGFQGAVAGAREAADRANSIFGRIGDLFKRFTGRADDGQEAFYQFSRGVQSTNSGLSNMISQMVKADLITAGIIGTLMKMKNVVGGVTSAVGGMVSQIFGLDLVTNSIRQIFTGFVDLAARVDTLRETMETLGENAGIPLDFLNDKMQELRESGITTQGAYQSLITFMSQKLPIQRITELSRAAQDMAVAFGVNSTEAFQRFTASITRGTTELLDIFGIANASVMFEQYAATLDKTAMSLSHAEKQQAILNGILEAAQPYAGAYENALDSVGKKIGSLARKIEEASLALGQAFLPVLSSVVDAVGDFAKWLENLFVSLRPQLDIAAEMFTQVANAIYGFFESKIFPIIEFAVSNIGNVIQVFRDLGEAIASIFRGDLPGALESFRSYLEGIGAFFIETFEGLVTNAFDWGRGVIVQFANGIMDAANQALVWAMDQIGSIMGLFLAPGSPPQEGELSKIDQWGEGVAQAFMDGMQRVTRSEMESMTSNVGESYLTTVQEGFRDLELESFKIIRDSMGPIRQAFQSMVSLGEMPETDLVPNLMEVRELLVELSNEFEDTGEISANTLDKIGERLGKSGEDVKRYIELQYRLQKAKKGLEEIDQRIAIAEQAGYVSRGLTEERAGKLAEIEAIEDELALQKEMINWQQESRDLTRQQVQLLKQIADQQKRAAEAAAKGQKDQWQTFLDSYHGELAALERKKALGLITEEEYQKARLGLERRYIDTAIKLNKPLDESRINAFKQLEATVDAMSGRGGKMSKLANQSNELWDQMVADIRANQEAASRFDKALDRELGRSFKRVGHDISGAREKMSGMFDTLGSFVKLPIGEKLAKLTEPIQKAWAQVPENIRATVSKIVNIAIDIFGKLKEVVMGVVQFILNAVRRIISGGGIVQLAKALYESVRGVLEAIIGAVRHFLRAFQAVFGRSGDLAKSAGGFVDFMARLGTTVGSIIDRIAKILAGVIKVVGGILERVIGLIARLLRGIFEFFATLYKRLSESGPIREAIDNISTLMKWLWGQIKPIVILIVGALGAILAAAIGIVDGLSNALGPFANLIADVVELLASIINVIVGPIAATLKFFSTLVREGPKAAFEGFIDYLHSWYNNIINIIASIPRIIKGILETAIGFLVGFVDGVVGTITGRFGEVIDRVNAVGDAFEDLVSGLWNKITGGGGAKEAVQEFEGSFDELALSVANSSETFDEYKKGLDDLEKAHKDEIDRNGVSIDQISKLTESQFNLAKARETEVKAADKQNRAVSEWVEKSDEAFGLLRGLDRQNYLLALAMERGNVKLVERLTAQRDTNREMILGDSFLADLARREGVLTGAIDETNAALVRQGEQFQGLPGMINRMAGEVTYGLLEIQRQAAEAVTTSPLQQAFVESLSGAGSRIQELLQEQGVAMDEYSTTRQAAFARHASERKELEAKTNDEIIADMGVTKDEALLVLQDKHANEIAELDKRYREEARLRRIAIAEALLDLNNQVLQEKLARAVTGEEAAQYVRQAEENAQAVLKAYHVEAEAAELMGAKSADAMFLAAFHNADFVQQLGMTTDQAIGLFAKLQQDGYDALSTKSQETLTAMLVQMAQFQLESGGSIQDITNSLALLPQAYQEKILPMLLDEKAKTEDIVAALRGIDTTIEPVVKVRMEVDRDAREPMQLRSPKTQMQEALENLVDYTAKTPITISILFAEGSLEAFRYLIDTFLNMEEILDVTMEAISSFSSSAQMAFTSFRMAITGPGGAMTKMFDEIVAGFEKLGDTYAILGRFKNAVVRLFYEIGYTSAAAVVDGMRNLRWMLDDLWGTVYEPGTLLFRLYNLGIEAMKTLAAGIITGFNTYIAPALEDISSAISKLEGGPLSLPASATGDPILDALTDIAAAIRSLKMDSVPGTPVVGALSATPTTIYVSEVNFPGVLTGADAIGVWEQLEREVTLGRSLGRAGFAR